MNETNELPHLTEHYHKARKQYGFFSALLMAWELVGLETIPGKVATLENVQLKNFYALPYVLLALIAYYFYRIVIEWFQVDERRRDTRAAKWDFWMAHVIAILALSIFAAQRLSKFEVAKDPFDFFTPIIAGVSIPVALNFRHKYSKSRTKGKANHWYRGMQIVSILSFLASCILFYGLSLKINSTAILLFILAICAGLIKNALDGVCPFKEPFMTK